MAAAVPVAAFLPTEDAVSQRAHPERFVRVCIRHRTLVEESMIEAGHGHVEVMGCPGTKHDPPHRVHAWGVYDLFRGRVIAIGTEGRIILLEGFDIPVSVVTDQVPDVPGFLDQLDAAYEKSGRKWLGAMSKLPAAAPKPAPAPANRRLPLPGRRSVSQLGREELIAVKTAAWKPGADQAAIALDYAISATDVLKIKHGMVGH